MIILTGARGSGKTYNLFANCEAQGIPIVVSSKKKENELKLYAKRLGFNVQILDIFSPNFTLEYYPKIAIDNIEEFICELFESKKEIVITTTLGTVVELSQNREKR